MGSSVAELTAKVNGQTVASLFLQTVGASSGRTALRQGVDEGGVTLTYGAYADQVARVAAALAANGVKPGDRVVLMLRNSVEFHVADLAITMCGATPISIYNSSSVDQIAYLIGHCEATLAIVEDGEFADRISRAQPQTPTLGQVINLADGGFAELLTASPVDLEASAARVRPDDLATVIYTSGTTGPPKGVRITHFNVAYTAAMLRAAIDGAGVDPVGFRAVSYLPMAHIAERLTTHYGAIAQHYDVTCLSDMSLLAPALRTVHPDILVGVPRVWEKLRAGLLAGLSADPDKFTQFEQGIDAAGPIAVANALGEASDEDLATLAFLDEVAFAPVRAHIGLDELKIAVTSAAPIAPELVMWFRALGVPITELYGLSETSGPMTWEVLRPKPGWVGRQMAGCEVRLADDGEVMCRGGNVFDGYLDNPEKTDEILDNDGWLHSGDIGEFDDDGYLRIIDRKKELIITAGGKNISPSNIEAKLKLIPLVGQACAIGDGRPFISALLVLDPDQAAVYAAAQGLPDAGLSALSQDPAVRAAIAEGLDEVMVGFNNVERVKKFVILGVDWLPDSDELTPTAKLKRRNIVTKYEAEIASMYS